MSSSFSNGFLMIKSGQNQRRCWISSSPSILGSQNYTMNLQGESCNLNMYVLVHPQTNYNRCHGPREKQLHVFIPRQHARKCYPFTIYGLFIMTYRFYLWGSIIILFTKNSLSKERMIRFKKKVVRSYFNGTHHLTMNRDLKVLPNT